MPLRLDVVHTRSTTLGWTEELECPKCQRRWKAGVRVTGTGRGSANYGIGNQQARDRAGIEAFSNASEEGARLIRLAACPACGHRQGLGLSLVGVGGGFIVGLMAASIGALLPRLALLACVLWPGVWFAVARWDQRRNQRLADARVVFEAR
ncbi:MAG: hypothetical protein U0228_31975 [Myxococcaceae bacterium]